MKKLNAAFTPLEIKIKNVFKKSLTGFTFIELLIALTIFSIIASSIYYTLNAGIRVWTRGNEIIKENQGMRIFFGTISQDLKNAVSFSGVTPEWGGDRISFPAIINVYAGDRMETELVKMLYYLDGAEGGVVRVRARAKDGFNEETAEKNILLDNVEGLSFQYCYKSEEEGEYEWQNTWGAAGEPEEDTEVPIPRGVKIGLTLKNEEAEAAGTFEKVVFIPLGILGEE